MIEKDILDIIIQWCQNNLHYSKDSYHLIHADCFIIKLNHNDHLTIELQDGIIATYSYYTQYKEFPLSDPENKWCEFLKGI